MAYRTIVFRQHQLTELLQSPHGTLGRHFQRTGAAVTRECKTLAGQKLQRGPGPKHYADSFRSEVQKGGLRGELRLRVWNDRPKVNGHDVAAGIEAGTPAHIIRPKKVGGVLVFKAKTGETVFTNLVNHPGTQPYRIMETALRRVVGRDR